MNPDSGVWSLAALAVPAGARVRVVRSAAAAPIDAELAARGCAVDTAAVAARSAVNEGATFDAVVLADGFEQLDDPIAALADAVALAGTGGHLIVVARNAAHAKSRVGEFLGDADPGGSALPPRRYDLTALERVVAKAGLVILDRIRALDTPESDATDAELLARADGPEARTSHFVLVTARAGEAVGAAAPTLTEVLQRSIEEGNANAEASLRLFHELEADRDGLVVRLGEIEAELERATATVDEQRIELEARADALAERVELVDRLHTERRHLELDLAVKDDYIAILRAEVLHRRGEYEQLKYDFDDLLRSRHYRAAVFLHRILKAIPFVHRLVTGTTKRVAPIVRGSSTTPPPE